MRANLIPILSDNYAWLLRCSRTGSLAIVDPAEPGPVIEAIEADIAREGGRLETILLTHHHGDHVAGTDAVRAHFSARVVGANADRHRLPRLDVAVAGGDHISVGDETAAVIETPGHTVGHISFVFPAVAGEEPVMLCGDTLFSLGCGRLLEGTPAMMFESLARLGAWPDGTLVCCGHEYTESNARFALSVDPGNAALVARATEVGRLRAEGRPTLPSRLGDEKLANPFMRARDVEELAALRAGKDGFRG
jgi:hydroxyacylglutathione hydrolase